MADWKTHISYNYNPACHAYTYGLVYQPGPEQSHGNLAGWGETGVTDMSGTNAGMTQAYYAVAAAARNREESPPRSPDEPAENDPCHYQGSGVVYLGDTTAGRLLLSEQHRATYDERAHEARRAGSDSTSDSEAYISPGSWSSASSREGSLPHTDPTTWVKGDLDEANRGSRSPGAAEVSSSLVEEPGNFVVTGNEGTGCTAISNIAANTPKKQSTTVVNNRKAKLRAAFTEAQMNVLVQRFSVQRYLSPGEMKSLAEVTGLTYKQVKTWFQNRRMKLRRHQKDTSWVSERFAIKKDCQVHTPVFNLPPHIPPYQTEALPHVKDHYTQHMMEAAFKTSASQNLAFYLAAVGPTSGSGGYPSWSTGPHQTAVPSRPQVVGWPMPPGISHYEYNPSAFNMAGAAPADTAQEDKNHDSKDVEGVGDRSPLNTALGHNIR